MLHLWSPKLTIDIIVVCFNYICFSRENDSHYVSFGYGKKFFFSIFLIDSTEHMKCEILNISCYSISLLFLSLLINFTNK